MFSWMHVLRRLADPLESLRILMFPQKTTNSRGRYESIVQSQTERVTKDVEGDLGTQRSSSYWLAKRRPPSLFVVVQGADVPNAGTCFLVFLSIRNWRTQPRAAPPQAHALDGRHTYAHQRPAVAYSLVVAILDHVERAAEEGSDVPHDGQTHPD